MAYEMMADEMGSEMTPEMLERLAAKEKAARNFQNKKKHHKNRERWGDERTDDGWPDYEA